MLESLSLMALPQSEMALLQRSSTIGASHKTKKQILRELALHQKWLKTGAMSQSRTENLERSGGEGDDSMLSGTSWRRKKKRRRRKLKVEKVVLDPRPSTVEESCSSERESHDSSGVEDGGESDGN